VDGRSDELRANWGSTAKLSVGICVWQNRPFRSPCLRRKRIENHISITGRQEEGADSEPAISVAGIGAGRRSQCEPLAEVIAAKVEVGLSARRIYQDLVEQNDFNDSYQSVQRFVRKLKKRNRSGFGAWKVGLARKRRWTSVWELRFAMESADHEGAGSFAWS